jgi:hypothetical protein
MHCDVEKKQIVLNPGQVGHIRTPRIKFGSNLGKNSGNAYIKGTWKSNEGDFIEFKIVAATVFLLLVAGIGVAYAAQWHPMMNFLGRFGGNWTNATGNWTRFNGNLTNSTGMWARFNGSSMNATGNYTAEYQQFIQALSNNDYATAQQLNQEYGFGGKLFDKLNATTFSQLSQIYTLSTELRQELGIKGQPCAFPYARGFVNGFRAGNFVGAHSRHGHMNANNSSNTS